MTTIANMRAPSPVYHFTTEQGSQVKDAITAMRNAPAAAQAAAWADFRAAKGRTAKETVVAWAEHNGLDVSLMKEKLNTGTVRKTGKKSV